MNSLLRLSLMIYNNFKDVIKSEGEVSKSGVNCIINEKVILIYMFYFIIG
jgi:hypothetical protein